MTGRVIISQKKEMSETCKKPLQREILEKHKKSKVQLNETGEKVIGGISKVWYESQKEADLQPLQCFNKQKTLREICEICKKKPKRFRHL